MKIERLAACFPLSIKYESRRHHIQRFLKLFSLNLSLFWFPMIMMIISQEFYDGSRLILTIVKLLLIVGLLLPNLENLVAIQLKMESEILFAPLLL